MWLRKLIKCSFARHLTERRVKLININYEILQDIITDHNLCDTQKEELSKIIEKLIPYKITYKMDLAIVNVVVNLKMKVM